jgi:hypothetical protein
MMKRYIKGLQREIQGKWWFRNHDHSIMESFLTIIADSCDHLPFVLKKWTITAFDIIGVLIVRIINLLFSMVSTYYLLEGIQRESNKKIKILIKGNPESLSPVIDKICNHITHIKKIDRKKGKKIWRKKNNFKKNNPDIFIGKSDMFYIYYYQRKGCFVFPEYVSFHLDTTKDIKEILNNVSSDIIKDIEKAKKTKYSYQVHNNPKSFKLFYFQMYLPYMRWKHKDSKRIASYATVRHIMAQGAELLMIKHGSNYIFGGMFLKEKNEIKTHYAGLMNGKFNHLHNGVMALSYYYLIKIAKEYKCNSIDFGSAPPFLDDGLYAYKNKWNMSVTPTSPFFSDIFIIKIIKNNIHMDEFISAQKIHFISTQKSDVDVNMDLK